MSITTVEAFLEALRKSKLLSVKQIATVREAAAEADRAESLAGMLLKEKLLTRWQAGQLLAGRTSFFLGRYKLVDLLGRGGMGSVFSAVDTKMSRPVALKIISKQLGRDPDALERFFAEARAIAALDHPNIVRAYDVDNTSDRYFIVMEFAEGRNLQQVVQSEGPLGSALAADYIRQAAEGLAHAHSRGIVHRDVKPANLVVNDRGVVKVLDMGMARLVAGQTDDGDGEDDTLLGTVDYLAPEQAMGDSDADHRVDLYSLGCTLYFLLTSSPPFPEGGLAERIVKHQTQDPPPIADLRPDAPEQLVAICEKLMAKDAGDRFRSADQVAGLLADWQPPQEDLQAAIPVAEPAGEEEPKRVIKISEPVFAGNRVSGGSGPLDIKIDTSSDSSIGRRTAASTHRGEDMPSLGNIERLLADRRIVIAAAAVAAIVVLGIVAGLFFLFSGGDRTDVAKAVPGRARQASGVPGTGNRRGASKDGIEKKEGKGEDGEKGLPEMNTTDVGLDKLEALVGDKTDKEPRSPPQPKREPDKPEVLAEKDFGKPDDAAKPAGDPVMAPDGAKKPDTKAEKKPDEETKPETATPKKPEEKKPAKTTPPPPKPVKPLEKLKEVVGIPELREKDRPGEASRAPLSMGSIDAPDTKKIELFLLGGDDAIKGDRKFTMAAESDSKASWMVQLDAAEAGGKRVISPVAKVSREGKGLLFQWADEAQSVSANYLRNCILQVRLDAQNKYLRLGEPVIAEPIVLNLAGGRANQSVALKWLPDTKRLRIAIVGVEGRTDFLTRPEEPVPPKTRIALVFPRKDRHGNSAGGVQFRITSGMRRAMVNLDVRLTVTPEIVGMFKSYQASGYSIEQLGTAQDKLSNEKTTLDRRFATAKGADKPKLSLDIDVLDFQLWYLRFYTEVHRQAKVHYRIFIEADGREVVLATSATKPIESTE